MEIVLKNERRLIALSAVDPDALARLWLALERR